MTVPLRILHFTMGRLNPDSANGVDKTAYHLVRTEAALGHAVRVVSLTEKPPLPIEGATVNTFPPRRFPLPLPEGPLRELLSTRWPFNLPNALVQDVLSWKPDIVHLHFIHSLQNIALGAVLRRHGIPYCVTINGGLAGVAQRRRKWIKQALAVLAERRYLNQAAFLHCISEQDLAGTLQYGARNQVVLAPNGIDLRDLPSMVDSGYLGRRFPESAGKRTFLYLGRLDPEQKGLDLLLEGFAGAAAQENILVLVGPDWRGNLQGLQARARTLGIAHRVLFPGAAFGQTKYDLLAGADVFVHPSRWEAGIPFSVLEAALAGKPCLVTPGADPMGLLSGCGGGLNVPADVPALTKAIDQFARMGAAELQAMGSQGRRLVETKFAWERIAEKIVEAYLNYARCG